MPFRVTELRRYPVKSMGGESVDVVDLDARGIVGDRGLAVVDGEGRLASGKSTRRFRRRDAVFEYRAVSAGDEVRVHGADGSWRAGDPALDEQLSAAMGDPVQVRPEAGTPHQDAGSVSLIGSATLAWCARELGVDADPHRLRVNIVVESDEPFIEETWVGRTVRIGRAQLQIRERVSRCRMIDLAQDGAAARQPWLAPLVQRRDGHAAVYADVATAGPIAVGDALWPPTD